MKEIVEYRFDIIDVAMSVDKDVPFMPLKLLLIKEI